MISSRPLVSISSASILLSCLSVAAIGCSGAYDESTGEGSTVTTSEALTCNVDVPSPVLAVPAGNKVTLEVDATGVQIYACQATATGHAWVFQAPEADLYRNGHHVGTHYAGPTWEWQDGSKVVGARVAGFTPDPSSIPWLLLRAASHEGDGRMSEVTYIQRLDTAAGIAPTTGCDAGHVGAVARVDYTTRYVFYKAANGCS
jgi:hypothetical protein